MPNARVGDINMEYHIEGQGPPLLMIMGLGGQASSWGEPFLTSLRPHFRIIRFSNRGTGQTDKPSNDVTIRLMADDAAGLLQELGIESAHVLGISMGGMIAQELALNHAQRVQGLVLGCTMCGFKHGTPARPEVWSVLAPQPGVPPEEQMRKSWPIVSTPEFAEREREFLEEMLRTELVHPTPIATLVRHIGAIQGFDTYDRLPKNQASTLIIHGDRDQLIPVQNASVLRERIANSTLHTLADTGHTFFWEKPEESAEAIVEFLSSVAAPA